MTNEEKANYQWALGISLSKNEIFACLIRIDSHQTYNERFSNNITGLSTLKKWSNSLGNDDGSNTLCCLEYSGFNIQALIQYLIKDGFKVWLRSYIRVNRKRKLIGEDLGNDAIQIANYAVANQKKAVPLTLLGLQVEKLKDLQSTQKRIDKAILILESSTAKIGLRDEESALTIKQLNIPALKGLKESKDVLEEKISHYAFSLKISKE